MPALKPAKTILCHTDFFFFLELTRAPLMDNYRQPVVDWFLNNSRVRDRQINQVVIVMKYFGKSYKVL